MSTHAITVVEIGEVLPHPNADRMEVTHVFGWQCCVSKGQFKPGDKAVYVPPDYLVPTGRQEFSFLKRDGHDAERISVRRFRGQLSQGLLIPALPEWTVGQDVMGDLGIVRYEPPMRGVDGVSPQVEFVGAPSGIYCPKFDVENYQRYASLFTPGEPVAITEKIHGANARFTYCDGQQYCGSRTNWMKKDGKNLWWRAMERNPAIGDWCKANPGRILYGEVFGRVQGLTYGAGPDDVFFAAFAVLDGQRWMNFEDFLLSVMDCGVNHAPLVFRGPFDPASAMQLAESDSRWPGANHMGEGVVVVPEKERTDDQIGRVILKIVSNRYLMS